MVLFDKQRLMGEEVCAEGDCACPLPLPPVAGSPQNVPEQTRWKQSKPVYRLPLTLRAPVASCIRTKPPLTVLLSPAAPAGIAVVDAPAHDSWTRYATPQFLPEKDQYSEQTDLRALQTAGFLVPADHSGIQPVKSDTLIAWLHTTNACNLRCTYCYLAKTSEKMTADVGRYAVDAVFRAARRHGYRKVKLKFAGGEPTLVFSQVMALHKHARELSARARIALRSVLLSNGVRLKAKMVEEMLAHDLQLMISVDGTGAVHDAQRPGRSGRSTSEAVWQAIDLASRMGLKPSVCVTVTGRNAIHLPELMGEILRRDLPFSLNFYRENAHAKDVAGLQLEEAKIIDGLRAAYRVIEHNLPRRSLLASLVDRANFAAPHQRPCAAGENYLVIDQFGRIAACQMEIENPVSSIRADDPLRELQDATSGGLPSRTGLQSPPVDAKAGCRDCKWKYWCAGGCPHLTYRTTGRYDVKSPNCSIYKQLYPEVVRLEALRLFSLYGSS